MKKVILITAMSITLGVCIAQQIVPHKSPEYGWILFRCFVVGMVGCLLQTILKIRSFQQKSKAGNYSFKPTDYFKEDWLTIASSVCTILLALFFIDEKSLQFFDANWKLMALFAFIGYTGSDVASRFFSVVNKKMNQVIDHKTNVADNVNNGI